MQIYHVFYKKLGVILVMIIKVRLKFWPARIVKSMLNRKIMLDFDLKFCYTIIVERARKKYRLRYEKKYRLDSESNKSTKLLTNN